jgi:BsuBI/PstI restriction endonuclease domain/BsuBI/PstI restriction endonuclease HTH domain
MSEKSIALTIQLLKDLGMPRAQLNERSALTLLALVDLPPGRKWAEARNRMIGITPIMDWIRENYGKPYAPNTRETFRRQTMHQFVDAGIALYNPDDPKRAVNSPHAVYQISPEALTLLRTFESRQWAEKLEAFLQGSKSLAERYARARDMNLVAVRLGKGKTIRLSPGRHSELIGKIVTEFAARFVPNGVLIYAGDTGNKVGYFDQVRLTKLGLNIDQKGKLPDVIIFDERRKWLVLVEAVTSHGPVDAKRHNELLKLFSHSKIGIVYVTAFPDRKAFARFLPFIAWETEVWTADSPSHLVHFNGSRFLGPY